MGTEDYSWLKRKRPKGKAVPRRKPPPSAAYSPRKTKAQVRRFNAIKDAVILADEVSKELDEVMGLEFGHLRMFRSKVSSPKSRQHRPLDREILKRMAKYVKGGGSLSLAAHDRRVVLKFKGAKHPKKFTTKRRPAATTPRKSISRYLSPIARACIKKIEINGEAVHQISVPAWDHTSIVLRALAYAAAIPTDACWTFSLHIRRDVFDAGLRSKKGVAGYLQDRIVRHLKAQLGSTAGFFPDFMMILEGYRSLEAFHVHGVYDTSWRGTGPKPPGMDLATLIEDTLVEAAGKITDDDKKALYMAGGLVLPKRSKAGPSTARQLKVKPVDGLPGWIEYCTKHMLTTANELRFARKGLGVPVPTKAETLMGITLNLRKLGKASFNAARRSGGVWLRA